MKEKILIHDLHKSFGPKVVLDGLDLTVFESEILCIIGISGVGKSVILKHLMGILEPESGSIIVDGVEFTGADTETRRSILSKYGILFQGAALFDSLNIYDNVAFGLRRQNTPEETIQHVVPETLAQVGLKNVEEKRVSELSGGMQKRVGLARSIAMKPEIMLYDEPTTGVDPITGGAVDRLIAHTRDTFGVTSVVVTHDIRSAYRIADRIAMLYDGKIIYEGPPDTFRSSVDPMVRQFIDGRAHGPIQVL
ncbi:MAG: ATP-binding cassette domain-containing protein [Spirochaetes bacterium]|nr:ATP-binding cassette domain-containing protein [Spirochaetota bacterium]